MRVHHLDCCTMCPRGMSALNGEGSLFARARLASHCLARRDDVTVCSAHDPVEYERLRAASGRHDTRRAPVLARAGAATAVRGAGRP